MTNFTKIASPNIISAGTVIGDAVQNLQGEKLGTIKEIMLDTRSGTIAYAVLSFGGLFGLGAKLFAVPWQAMKVDGSEECLRLDVSKERLERAEGFDEDDWPNFADPQWSSRVHDAWGVPVSWSREPRA